MATDDVRQRTPRPRRRSMRRLSSFPRRGQHLSGVARCLLTSTRRGSNAAAGQEGSRLPKRGTAPPAARPARTFQRLGPGRSGGLRWSVARPPEAMLGSFGDDEPCRSVPWRAWVGGGSTVIRGRKYRDASDRHICHGDGTLSGVKAVTGDSAGSCALLTSGEQACWGYGVNGELGERRARRRRLRHADRGLRGRFLVPRVDQSRGMP